MHSGIQEFLFGGGVSVMPNRQQKKSSDIDCFSPIILQGSRWGSNIFKGRRMSNFSQRVQLLIPIAAYRICDFPGGGEGGWNPCPPSAHEMSLFFSIFVFMSS